VLQPEFYPESDENLGGLSMAVRMKIAALISCSAIAAGGLFTVAFGAAGGSPDKPQGARQPANVAASDLAAVAAAKAHPPVVVAAAPEPAVNDAKIVAAADDGGAPYPFNGSLYHVATVYRGHLGSHYLNLYSGSSLATPTDGVVFVSSPDAGSGSPLFAQAEIRVPGAGDVKLVSVQGAIVKVAGSDGKTYSINLATDAVQPIG
jgi:hypothetical protein